MFQNFREKPFTEKTIRILTAITLLIGIPLTIKQIWFSDDKQTQTTSGASSPIINGNGNTYNNNTYNVRQNENSPFNSNHKESPSKANTVTQPIQIDNKTDNDKINKIAILPFENISQNSNFEWLSKGLSESLLEPFSRSKKYFIIEGTLRNKVLEEIEFQQSKYVDIKSAVKIGKMLGAKNIVIGSYQVNENTISITSRIVDVESGKIKENSTFRYEGSIKEPFQMQKDFSNYFYKKIDE